ncbi:MAG TPA: UDP-N-acetylglucosamine 2-epimerase (non-hydrolyzing), partial [Clostridiales bacterium UBA8153]|nr:UDP-N-acetylglucosamine 2-epimerase (non-hydrolyzing) [Clostridiales bacterium UBA8153]
MAPVIRELAAHPDDITNLVVVTAQHREMLDSVLSHFGIIPQYDLDIMVARQTLTDTAVRALDRLAPVIAREMPDLILVHGDTLTTLMGTLSAYFHQVPVGHVEAGLRTYDKLAPFPEEMMRRLADAVADLHFCATAWARDNLASEGIRGSSVFVTGNTAVDALLWTVRPDYRFSTPGLDTLGKSRRLVLVDVHRRENFGRPMQELAGALEELALTETGVELLVSAHLNPEAGAVLRGRLGGLERVYLMDPLSYPEWANLMGRATLLITDSGGLQEEAPAVGLPVLLAREKTERPEAVEAGTVVLVGTSRARLLGEARRLLHDAQAHAAMARASNPYGDGRAAARTVQGILYHFGRRPRPPRPWQP